MFLFRYHCLICDQYEDLMADDVYDAFDIARAFGHEPATIPINVDDQIARNDMEDAR